MEALKKWIAEQRETCVPETAVYDHEYFMRLGEVGVLERLEEWINQQEDPIKVAEEKRMDALMQFYRRI